MKKIMLLALMVLVAASFAQAQVSDPSNGDVLGAHNVYGRGCLACHAPHSGAAGNGGTPDATSGNIALWGQSLTPLYGQTLGFGDGGSFSITLPTYTAAAPQTSAHDPYFAVIACLSCHDGNLAKVAMTKGKTFEQVTINGFSFNPPTWLGNDGSTAGNYNNDHPIGPSANPGCGGSYNWDCTVNANGTFSFTGTNSAQFVTDYLDPTAAGGVLASLVGTGGFTSTTKNGVTTTTTTLWVSCTTCHDQHSMTDFSENGTHYQTRFFVRGWYNPGVSATSNNAAQFCRQCHGGESNEMHGRTIPTT